MLKSYLKDEVWKDIVGYEGLYQISNFGRVKSLPRNGTKNTVRYLKSVRDGNGYLFVCLCKNNKRKYVKIHRLVAQAFLDNKYNYPQINHKDENKENNYVENLEWCTAKYNINYGNRINIVSNKRSKKVCKFDINGNYLTTYKNAVEASNTEHLNKSHITACCLNYYGRKTVGGYIWKYEKDVLNNG